VSVGMGGLVEWGREPEWRFGRKGGRGQARGSAPFSGGAPPPPDDNNPHKKKMEAPTLLS
jgi:hypothetical protein